MKILLIAIAIAILFTLFFLPPIIRAIARIAADKMLCGKKTPTLKCMNRCVRVLTWSNNWITTHTKQDDLRIARLYVKLDEMLHPHG